MLGWEEVVPPEEYQQVRMDHPETDPDPAEMFEEETDFCLNVVQVSSMADHQLDSCWRLEERNCCPLVECLY